VKGEYILFSLKDLIKNFYPTQHLIIHIMGGEDYHVINNCLDELNPFYLDFNVRTIEIYRDELGKLKDIIKIMISEI
jgi:hypothetical protein